MIGSIVSQLIDKFFIKLASKVVIDSTEVAELLAESGSKVIYAFRRYSWFEIRLWNEVCKRLGLPQGEVFYMRERLGYEVSVSWVKSFRVSTKSRLELIKGNDFVMMPLSVFLGQGPKNTLRYIPDFNFFPILDFVKAIYYYFSKAKLTFRLGPGLKGSHQNSSSDFFRAISLALYKQEKIARGVRNNSLAETILDSELIESQINSISAQTGASRQQLYAEARKCFNEISASITPFSIKILYYVLRPIMRTVFSKIQVNGIDQLRQVIKDSPTVIVPSHRSHFDYLLIGWIFLHADLPLPYVAAGSNLNFFPVGRILKSAGAFFIRRKSHGDLIYKTVLNLYLNYLIKVGHVITFYIEGGRSRSGSMLNPKLGILKYIVKNWLEQGRRDISFVPISISYEKVAEEKALTRELGGEAKKSESFWQLLSVGKIWEKKFGEVVVNISPAFSLTEFQKQTQIGVEKTTVDLTLLTEDLGYHLSRQVMSRTAISSTALVALAAMSFDKYSITTKDLAARIKTIFDYITLNKEHERGFVSDYIRGLQKKTPLEQVIELLIEGFCKQGFATKENACVNLNPEKIILIDYYKNNIFQHVFAVSILSFCFENSCFSEDRLHCYQQIFKPYFLLNHWRFWREEQQKLLEHLVSISMLSKDKDSYLILNQEFFDVFKILLKPFAEAYGIVESNHHESFDELLKAARSDRMNGNSNYRLESSSKTYLEFAFKLQKRIQQISELTKQDAKKLMLEICS